MDIFWKSTLFAMLTIPNPKKTPSVYPLLENEMTGVPWRDGEPLTLSLFYFHRLAASCGPPAVPHDALCEKILT